jgi:hypothetical protein
MVAMREVDSEDSGYIVLTYGPDWCKLRRAASEPFDWCLREPR